MTRLLFLLPTVLGCVCLTTVPARAQRDAADASALATLSQKIDAQSTKIDALSQQILKLQQMVEQSKGEPGASTLGTGTAATGTSPAVSPLPGGSTHVVTRGETLTSIAHQYKVGIGELQKLNHIQDDRKLQIGQTLVIPGTKTSTPTATPNE
ncbi:MAG TPA: LysM peptidoglycan-binding domain-containing protein [Chthoniobacterales bacterium]|jgi:LysM repeat protein